MQTSSKTLALKLTKTPSNGSGTFEAVVAGWQIDHDNERFERDAFKSVDPERPYPLHYHHLPEAADPGATIGMLFAKPTDAGLRIVGQLDLKNPMAQAVYERMLLPANDPQALHEFSVGFEFDPAKTYKGDKGETVIPEAKLVEVSVVYRGAQKTELLSIKTGRTMSGAEALAEIEAVLTGKTDEPKTPAPPAPAIEGDALAMFAAMKKDLIATYPEMARTVFGELTDDERAAIRQKKLRQKGEDLALYGVMR
jgi:phage head maturation protease